MRENTFIIVIMTMMCEVAPASQVDQVELGAPDVLLAKGVGVDHLRQSDNCQSHLTIRQSVRVI